MASTRSGCSLTGVRVAAVSHRRAKVTSEGALQLRTSSRSRTRIGRGAACRWPSEPPAASSRRSCPHRAALDEKPRSSADQGQERHRVRVAIVAGHGDLQLFDETVDDERLEVLREHREVHLTGVGRQRCPVALHGVSPGADGCRRRAVTVGVHLDTAVHELVDPGLKVTAVGRTGLVCR
jgi:hypothetical protein